MSKLGIVFFLFVLATVQADTDVQRLSFDITSILEDINRNVLSFLQIIVVVVRTILQIVSDLETGQLADISYRNLITNISQNINNTNTNCVTRETNSFYTLLTNSTNATEQCYNDVLVVLAQLEPLLANISNNAFKAATNIVDESYNCLTKNQFLFGLPRCLQNVFSESRNELRDLGTQFRKLISTGRIVLNEFVNDTQSCLYVFNEVINQITYIFFEYIQCLV